jgi:hypothetical protein
LEFLKINKKKKYINFFYFIIIYFFILLLPNTSKLKLCSASPTLFDALIVYLPKLAGDTFTITNAITPVLASVSNLTSLFVNSLSFKNHDTFGFGNASIKHSNLVN